MTIAERAADATALTAREQRMEEARKTFEERRNRLADMVLTVLGAQITVERSMIDVLKWYGKDPNHFFQTGEKIKECKKLDPPGVGPATWELLRLCSHVRNELMHSLDDAKIKEKSDLVREAYIAVMESEVQKKSIRGMTDTQVVMSAIYHCGMLIMLALDDLAKEKK